MKPKQKKREKIDCDREEKQGKTGESQNEKSVKNISDKIGEMKRQKML